MIDSFYKKEDKMLLANVLDKYRLYQKHGKSVCTNFLNSEKLRLVTQYLNNKKITYSIYEPYPFLEKKIIYFGEYDNFITFYKVNMINLKHSHVLGTLFSLGLDDSLIGDIFIEDGYFYYTNLTRLNSFIENNLVVINNEIVTFEVVDDIVLNKEHFEELTILVSSMRLDNIVSKLTSKSRSQVNKMILEKLIILNYHEVKNANTVLKEDDILSIRKYGKFRIGKKIGLTKKENIVLNIVKYI